MRALLALLLCAALPAQVRFPPGAAVDTTVFNGKVMFTVVVPLSTPDLVLVEFPTSSASSPGWVPDSMTCWQVSTFDPRPCALGAWLALEHRGPGRSWTHHSLWPSPTSTLHTFTPMVAMDLRRLVGDVTTQWRLAYCTAGWQCPPVPCAPPAPQMVGVVFELTWRRGG